MICINIYIYTVYKIRYIIYLSCVVRVFHATYYLYIYIHIAFRYTYNYIYIII